MKFRLLLLCMLLAGVTALAQMRSIPSGTEIKVRTDTAIPANPAVGTVYTASVSDDVPDGQGGVAIPRGSRARLVAQNAPDGKDTVLDLRSVTVNGARYNLEAAGTQGTSSRGAGLGANKRTAKYVGGGAAIGAVLGALLGGGKGAAIRRDRRRRRRCRWTGADRQEERPAGGNAAYLQNGAAAHDARVWINAPQHGRTPEAATINSSQKREAGMRGPQHAPPLRVLGRHSK